MPTTSYFSKTFYLQIQQRKNFIQMQDNDFSESIKNVLYNKQFTYQKLLLLRDF